MTNLTYVLSAACKGLSPIIQLTNGLYKLGDYVTPGAVLGTNLYSGLSNGYNAGSTVITILGTYDDAVFLYDSTTGRWENAGSGVPIV